MTARQPHDRWSALGYILAGFACVALLALGVGGWEAFAEIEGAVVARGQLRMEARRQVVEHPDGGVIAEILVREGDRVTAGEPIIRLDGSALASELAVIESRLHETMARRGRLMAEQDDSDAVSFDPELIEAARRDPGIRAHVDGQRALLAARRETMASQLAALRERQAQTREEIAGTEAARAALARQRTLIAEELEAQRELLAKGLAQASRVLALEREAARLDGERGRIEAEAARLRGRIAELESEVLGLAASRREEALAELRDLGLRETELKERRIALRERLSRLDLRAPLDGIVLDMTAHAPGAVARPAEPVLHIVPTGSPLVVEARIDTTQIDSVRPGQEAVLRFPSFDARTTPELSGTVARISADAFSDPESRRSFYRAELILDEGEASRLGDGRLVAGMPVEVFIRTGARTPLEYLLKPIADHLARAMREE